MEETLNMKCNYEELVNNLLPLYVMSCQENIPIHVSGDKCKSELLAYWVSYKIDHFMIKSIDDSILLPCMQLQSLLSVIIYNVYDR